MTTAMLMSRERVVAAHEELNRILAGAAELDPYRDEPAQMPSGAPGKCGYLRLDFARDGERSVLADMDRRVPSLAQRALYWDEGLPGMPCIMIITTTGCVVQGDRTVLSIRVGEGAQAHVTTQSATKVHMMDANHAAQMQHIEVEDRGYLEFMPDPLILHRTARFMSHTRLSVAATGSCIYGEILLPGRKHHHPDEFMGFDVYSASISAIRRETGKVLFDERLVLEPRLMDPMAVGIMSGFEVFGNVLVLADPAACVRVREHFGSGVDHKAGLAWGISMLPHDAGMLCKVLGRTSESVKERVRAFWGLARYEITGAHLPPEFLWR